MPNTLRPCGASDVWRWKHLAGIDLILLTLSLSAEMFFDLWRHFRRRFPNRASPTLSWRSTFFEMASSANEDAHLTSAPPAVGDIFRSAHIQPSQAKPRQRERKRKGENVTAKTSTRSLSDETFAGEEETWLWTCHSRVKEVHITVDHSSSKGN